MSLAGDKNTVCQKAIFGTRSFLHQFILRDLCGSKGREGRADYIHQRKAFLLEGYIAILQVALPFCQCDFFAAMQEGF